jgi:hypothetical protein
MVGKARRWIVGDLEREVVVVCFLPADRLGEPAKIN